jgi:hypothetical protein
MLQIADAAWASAGLAGAPLRFPRELAGSLSRKLWRETGTNFSGTACLCPTGLHLLGLGGQIAEKAAAAIV